MSKKAEIRHNPINGRSVIFAPKRSSRPNDAKSKEKKEKTNNCPFCRENINKKLIVEQVPNKGKWEVAIIKNIFPALSVDNKKAYGYQEVLIDTGYHYENFSDLSQKQIALILELFKKRSLSLKKDKKINYILTFKNQGPSAGASLSHIHSQIFASSILPPELIEERNRVDLYIKKYKNCPYCLLVKDEAKGKRLIFQDKYITVFCPFASEFPYETWILSNRHVDNISLLKQVEIKSIAKALSLISKKLKNLNYDFNFFAHNDLINKNQHFYIKIQPRPNIWAGVELGSGLIINPVFPEDAATYYKK